MVDLHCHILPYIDDGSSSIEESIKMLQIMVENGVDTVVATPHFDFEKDNLNSFLIEQKKQIEILTLIIKEKQIPIEVISGVEVMFNSNLNNYDLSQLVIENTDYILIELSTLKNEPNLESVFLQLIGNGYIPVLAHIERYSYLVNNSSRLVNLIENGVIMQVNYECTKYKKKSFIKALLRNNLVHVIASDAHNMQSRRPKMTKKGVKSWFVSNSDLIIKNQPRY